MEIVEKKYVHVGGLCPPHIVDYLNLYAMNSKSSKSDIIRSAILDWWLKKKIQVSMEDLVNSVRNKFQDEWLEERSKLENEQKVGSKFQTFINSKRRELIIKNIPEEYINQLLNISISL